MDPQAWAAPDLGAGPGAPSDPVRPAPPDPLFDQARRVVDRSELLGGDIPLRPLGVSETMDAAITGIRRNPKAVLGLSLAASSLIHLLVALVEFFLIGGQDRNGMTPGRLLQIVGGQWLLSLVSAILTAYAVLVLAGLLGPVLGRTLFGLPATLGQTWREGRSALPRLLGVCATIMVVALLGLALPCLPFIVFAIANGPVPLIVIFALVGVPGGLVLMVWLYITYVLAPPAVVLEGASFRAALRRARILIQGRWWRIFGTLLLTLMITEVMSLLLQIPALILIAAVGTKDGGFIAVTILTLGRIFATSVTAPFDAGVIALLYIDLRMRREGLDLDVQTREVEIGGDFHSLWIPR
jgi:hypothetical protein